MVRLKQHHSIYHCVSSHVCCFLVSTVVLAGITKVFVGEVVELGKARALRTNEFRSSFIINGFFTIFSFFNSTFDRR